MNITQVTLGLHDQKRLPLGSPDTGLSTAVLRAEWYKNVILLRNGSVQLPGANNFAKFSQMPSSKLEILQSEVYRSA